MVTYPVRVAARLDRLSRWLWLVKWLLLIPHYLVLMVLWVAFVALTLVAYVAVLFTGRYPAGIFDFNVGVLRWTWRAAYYGYSALGTDRYPPFTLADVPDYPARLTVDGPPRPPRWLPLVAWLLALPHLIIVGLLAGSGWSTDTADGRVGYNAGVLGILVLVAGFALLFTGRYPAGLYDVMVGLNRWVLRTVAYVALLTDRYPPFRLDQGGDEPVTGPPGPKAPAWTGGSPTTSVVAGEAGPRTPLPQRSPAGSAGRVVAVVAGVMVLVAGVGAVVGGVAALGVNASRNAAGYVTSDPTDVSTPTAAVTVEGFEIDPAHIFDRDVTGLGTVRIEVSSATAAPLFIGVAHESDVDAWLAGTGHDEVTGIHRDGSRVTLRRAAGTVRPLVPPADEEFWLASTSGTGNLRLDWQPGDGRFAVVLANADGSTGLTATVTAGAEVPALGPLGAGLLTGGLVGVLAGALLLYLGAVAMTGRPPRPGPPPPQWPAPPVPPEPPQAAPDEPRTASMAR
jgi:hypothetical protein